jgi:hypothetical protein
MTAFKKIAMTALLAATSATAHAECSLAQFDIANGNLTANYDPFDAAQSPVTVSIRSIGNADCANQRVMLSIEADVTTPSAVNGSEILLSSGADNLTAQLTGPNGRAAAGRFAAGSPTALLLLGSAGDVRSGDLLLSLRAGQRVPPGLYTARLKVIATPLLPDGSNGQPFSSIADILINVMPSVGLAVGSETTIDIGTISDGAKGSEPIKFQAYGNTGYELTFESDNGFALVQNGRKDGARIDYIATLENKDIDPDALGVSFSDPGNSGFRNHRLNVRVPTVGRRPAGTYSDYITVKISANVAGN